ncbi:MAG: hypothetical protein J6S22_03880 [Clostridia bacterium]|nr:hypothetical protein [Clostridia bacterium]
MNTDNLLLILAFIFTQNKELMKEVGPVLDFLEEHKGAVDVLSQLLNAQQAAPANYAEPEQEKTQHKPHGDRAGENKYTLIPNTTLFPSIAHFNISHRWGKGLFVRSTFGSTRLRRLYAPPKNPVRGRSLSSTLYSV